MSIATVAHLNFRGDAAQALAFYQSVFGGHKVAVRYKDAGVPEGSAEADQILWGQVTSENGFAIMAYDVPSRMAWNAGENAFYVSVRGTDGDEITRLWAMLSQDAAIVQPLAPSPWSPLYGMLKDRFGVTWVLDVATAYSG